jgi:3-oxoacyl-[acyl-carrier-protein] synthase II
LEAPKVAVIIGSGIGGILTISEQFEVLQKKGPARISPFLVTKMLADMASGQVSIKLGAKGTNYSTVTACASGSDAIGHGYELIKRDGADVVIAGGTEASICPITISGFSAAGALSRRNENPKEASRPFDMNRDGFVMGEGSTILVIENLESALKRGAQPIAEIIGYGSTSDATHITRPHPDGQGGANAMRLALRQANLSHSEIDYINAHGTSTPLNDNAETQAIKAVFKEEAYQIPISSTKSMTGHLMGAAGALEVAVCALTIQSGIIHPTINLYTPDPACDLNYTPWAPIRGPVNRALTNSLGFGGHNSSLVLSKFES